MDETAAAAAHRSPAARFSWSLEGENSGAPATESAQKGNIWDTFGCRAQGRSRAYRCRGGLQGASSCQGPGDPRAELSDLLDVPESMSVRSCGRRTQPSRCLPANCPSIRRHAGLPPALRCACLALA